MQTLRLGDVCSKIGSGATPRGGSDVYLDSGTALIRSQNVYNDGFHPEGLAFIGERHAVDLQGVEVRAGDVLLNITGDSVARVCRAPADVLPARVNQHVSIIRPDPAVLDSRFLHYFLASPTKQASMLSLAGGGATRNALTKGMIENFEIPAPRVEEQRSIAAVLGSLDDKIEQNRRTGSKLEGLARATFKAWFVDFEPVRAKAAGQTGFPGMPAATFAALPDRLTDSPVGPVPQGWAVSTVGDAATLSKRQTNPQDHADELFEHFSIPAFDAGQNPVVEPGNGIKSQKFMVVPGCVLLSKLNPRIARVWLPPPPNGRRQIASTEFLVAIPKHGWTRESLYCLFQQDDFRESLVQNASGTSNSHQRVRPGDLLSRLLVVPAQPILDAFTEQVASQMALRESLQTESSKLAALRDYLLPRLLGGRVRVRPADTGVEAIA